ncbi:STAS domain-containing protein [Pseudonocardia charpentierae]|uniref:STAS domain-containing protein n=1 Tax=Pseudonocardia charpentierae TaxID=3075545 RepID=A0ABU2N7R5_9PSEU|nr:STAS domain-containing protein [Pseudonocardia sp. DSM 45834]MDT0349986.1 STAS domain-containing protein [Pseudonocardia sp. DSM 45834]
MTAHDSVPEFCPPPPMSVRLDVEVVREEAREAVVFVRGELDRASVPLLVGCLRELLHTDGTDRTVVVNLVGTTFVDVGGMCALLEATGSARRRGSRLYLAGCSTQLVRLLHLTDLFDEVQVISSGRT